MKRKKKKRLGNYRTKEGKEREQLNQQVILVCILEYKKQINKATQDNIGAIGEM